VTVYTVTQIYTTDRDTNTRINRLYDVMITLYNFVTTAYEQYNSQPQSSNHLQRQKPCLNRSLRAIAGSPPPVCSNTPGAFFSFVLVDHSRECGRATRMKPGGMNELRTAGRAAWVIFFQVTVSLRFIDTQGSPDVFWELRTFVLVRRLRTKRCTQQRPTHLLNEKPDAP
jgi:hypothetical protein